MSHEKPMAVSGFIWCNFPSRKRTWNEEADSGVQENIEETEGAFVGF